MCRAYARVLRARLSESLALARTPAVPTKPLAKNLKEAIECAARRPTSKKTNASRKLQNAIGNEKHVCDFPEVD